MKIFTSKSFTKKLIISIICIILLNFCITSNVQASIGGQMMSYMTDFATGIADVAASLIQFGVMGKWIYAVDSKGSGVPSITNGYFAKSNDFEYPILQVSPELIFANEIQLLDVNFISPIGTNGNYVISLENTSALVKLRDIIAAWYVTLRNIAIVGLLSVLIYIGIRIMISSTAADKAKYKQRIMDWVVAFCLLFFMHYIMAATISVVERVNDMFAANAHVYDGLEIPSGFGTVKYLGANSRNAEIIL